MKFVSRETIDKVRASIAEMEGDIKQSKLTLENAGRLGEMALEVKIGKELIGYIDAGMSADEFIWKSLKFCASSRSSVDAIPLRASYTIALVEEWEVFLPRDKPTSLAPPIRVFATSTTTGERFEITDQYWFEENGVHDWHGQGHYDNFTFEFYREDGHEV
jgi:hypothetical protein